MENIEERGRLDAIAGAQPPFGQLLGVRIVSAGVDEVVAEMQVAPALANRNGVLHGGALAGFVDNLCGTASFLNLAEGEGTTTIESKTNFLRAVEIGDVVRGVCVRLHKGRRTMVWQITTTRGDGKVASTTIQTQMVMRRGEG